MDDLRESKADKQQLEVEVRGVRKPHNLLHTVFSWLQFLHSLLQKADRTSLEKKASREWVDSTFERLDREIREARSKLLGQEEAFKVAFSQLNEDVEGKLDRLELKPLKDYFGRWMSEWISLFIGTRQWREASVIRGKCCFSLHADQKLERVKTAPSVVQKEAAMGDDAAGFRK